VIKATGQSFGEQFGVKKERAPDGQELFTTNYKPR